MVDAVLLLWTVLQFFPADDAFQSLLLEELIPVLLFCKLHHICRKSFQICILLYSEKLEKVHEQSFYHYLVWMDWFAALVACDQLLDEIFEFCGKTLTKSVNRVNSIKFKDFWTQLFVSFQLLFCFFLLDTFGLMSNAVVNFGTWWLCLFWDWSFFSFLSFLNFFWLWWIPDSYIGVLGYFLNLSFLFCFCNGCNFSWHNF